MQADATLPDGQTLTVEGFKLVDEDKLRALPEPIVIELHRNGMLMLMNLHIASLGGREIERNKFLSHLRALTATGEARTDWRASNTEFAW